MHLNYKSIVKRFRNSSEQWIMPIPVYKDGELVLIKKVLKRNGTEYPMGEVIVKKITSEVPVEMFNIPQGCKVYAVGIGDMNDLIEQPVLVEEY